MTVKARDGVMVQSVARALQILDCFSDNNEMGITDIADCMNLSKSTVYGLVNTLAAYGYLEQEEGSKRYRLGLRLFELGNLLQSRMDIRQEARPFCQQLADKYRTTVHLAVFSEGDVIYIDKIDNPNSVVAYSRIGKRAPMYCTGVGKAILAFLPDDYIDQYLLDHHLEQLTEHTIVTPEGLRDEMARIRSCGFAIDNEEIELGLYCVAAPVFDYRDFPVMALSVCFTHGRMVGTSLDEVSASVLYYSHQISERMGYSGH